MPLLLTSILSVGYKYSSLTVSELKQHIVLLPSHVASCALVINLSYLTFELRYVVIDMYYRRRVLFFEQALCVTPPSRMERYRTMGVTAGSPLTPSDCAHGLADSGLTGEFVRLPPIPSFFVSSASGVLA